VKMRLEIHLWRMSFTTPSPARIYHRDVDRYPLEKSYRFIIDVMIKVLTIIFILVEECGLMVYLFNRPSRKEKYPCLTLFICIVS
jgi:hypothetical protein